MSLISIKDLSYHYADGTEALKEISLDILEKQKVGIIGANGAGKSTLVNHICGYHLPQHGSVSVNNINLSKTTADSIRKIVGVIFQNADDQLFMTTVLEDVAFGLRNLGFSRDEAMSKARTSLDCLGISHLAEKHPINLSQGQKRYAAFAGVFVLNPMIIIMDEPTSDLDPKSRRETIELINKLEATHILVSHDLDFIWDTCDRVVVLSNGTITADGNTREILSNENLLKENGLELPLRLMRDN